MERKGIFCLLLLVGLISFSVFIFLTADFPETTKITVSSKVVKKRFVTSIDVPLWLLLDIMMPKTEYYLDLEDGSTHWVTWSKWKSYEVGDFYSYEKTVLKRQQVNK